MCRATGDTHQNFLWVFDSGIWFQHGEISAYYFRWYGMIINYTLNIFNPNAYDWSLIGQVKMNISIWNVRAYWGQKYICVKAISCKSVRISVAFPSLNYEMTVRRYVPFFKIKSQHKRMTDTSVYINGNVILVCPFLITAKNFCKFPN